MTQHNGRYRHNAILILCFLDTFIEFQEEETRVFFFWMRTIFDGEFVNISVSTNPPLPFLSILLARIMFLFFSMAI